MLATIGVRISFPLNLYIHLEIASGSPPVYFSKKYCDYVQAYLPQRLRENFIAQTRGYDFSLSMRLVASRAKSIEDIMLDVVAKPVKWRHTLKEAARHYLPFWENEAQPNLQAFVHDASTQFSQILEGAKLIPEMTGHNMEIDEVTILPVHAVSDEFGFGGQPIGKRSIMIGPAESHLFVLGVLHEIAHLNLGDKIDLLGRRHGYEPDILTESVANMVTGTLIRRLHLTPPSERDMAHGPDTDEYRSFLDKFENYNKLIRPLWKQYLETTETEGTRNTIHDFLETKLTNIQTKD